MSIERGQYLIAELSFGLITLRQVEGELAVDIELLSENGEKYESAELIFR